MIVVPSGWPLSRFVSGVLATGKQAAAPDDCTVASAGPPAIVHFD
ncbi:MULTISPECIES: hypothetical protein [unclassified Burkholderia]|nr:MULTISPECIES: hypothetical protein [unclassified Burkholderia]